MELDVSQPTSTKALTRAVSLPFVAESISYGNTGRWMACASSTEIRFIDAEPGAGDREILPAITDLVGLTEIEASPLDSFLSTLHRTGNGHRVCVWRLGKPAHSLLLEFTLRAARYWKPQFARKENFVAILGNDSRLQVATVPGHGPVSLAACASLPRVDSFCLINGTDSAATFAAFSRRSGDVPASIKLLRIAANGAAATLCNRSLMANVDSVAYSVSPLGNSALVSVQTEVDSTGRSYYGESHLFVASLRTETLARVSFPRPGPVHDAVWRNEEKEASFATISGLMPASVCLWDSHGDLQKDLGEQSRNAIRFNDASSLFFVGGFGNIPGHVDVWHAKSMTQLAQFQEPGTSVMQWLPTGCHLLAATLFSKLRVDNALSIFNALGQRLHHQKFPVLLQVAYRPFPDGTPREDRGFDVTVESCRAMRCVLSSNGDVIRPAPVKSVPYVPPSRRNGASQPQELAPLHSTADPEDRAIKLLSKKLHEIALLKEKVAAGSALDAAQMEKIKKEESFRLDLEKLTAKKLVPVT